MNDEEAQRRANALFPNETPPKALALFLETSEGRDWYAEVYKELPSGMHARTDLPA